LPYTEINPAARAEIPKAADRPYSGIIDEQDPISCRWFRFCLDTFGKEEVMAVVTLSRQIGSWGDEIAVRTCEILDYRYFDKQLMLETAAEVGLVEHEVIDFSEDHYEVQDFISKLFRSGPRTVKHVIVREDVHGLIDPLSARVLNEAQCASLVRYTVLMAYETGDIVIVGRGGQAILKDKPGALHVRVIAPPEVRVQRLREQGMAGISDIKTKINQQDRATAEYLDRFFGIKSDDPAHYHLMINTGLMGIEEAAQVIAAAVNQLKSEPLEQM
jgi:cytidylate kinase